MSVTENKRLAQTVLTIRINSLIIKVCWSLHVVQEQPELKDVFGELFPLSAQWKTIGTLLGVPENVLERIKADEDSVQDRLQKVLSEWLKQVDSRPTWAALAEAVEPVDQAKSHKIKTRYIDTKF